MKKIFLFSIPMSICNFRCSYCYLAQRPEHFEGVMPEFKYTPEEFGRAMSMERVGGSAFGNFTATGETLLTKNLDKYIKAFVEQGHYAEIVTNLSITQKINEILEWDKELLKRVEFKCSFHYRELKNRGLLETYAQNVNNIWKAGASANIEITPSDEDIPLIDEIKEFSMKHFKALPHLTIARDDTTEGMGYLTKLPIDEYDKIWGQFDSEFWRFKKTIFGVKQTGYCYAGEWSCYVNLTTGVARQCYCGVELGDIFAHPEEAIPEKAIGLCQAPHCFNGHMLLAAGLIPEQSKVCYGNIRNRKMTDGNEWLKPELLEVFNERVYEQNKRCSMVAEQFKLIKRKIRGKLKV